MTQRYLTTIRTILLFLNMLLVDMYILPHKQNPLLLYFTLVFISLLTFISCVTFLMADIIKNFTLKLEGLQSAEARNVSLSTLIKLLVFSIHPNLFLEPLYLVTNMRIPSEDYEIPINIFAITF